MTISCQVAVKVTRARPAKKILISRKLVFLTSSKKQQREARAARLEYSATACDLNGAHVQLKGLHHGRIDVAAAAAGAAAGHKNAAPTLSPCAGVGWR